MRTVQIVLNSILSKNIFEYILVDKNLHILEYSQGIKRYLEMTPKIGSDILEYIPEFIGNEDEIKKIFIQKYCLFTLETIQKNDYYINISIEYCDSQTAIVLLHNVTSITIHQQNLLQYSNESTLLYNTLNKVINNQNSMVFVANINKIEFANQQFLNYFNIPDLQTLTKDTIKIYKYIDSSIEDYTHLYELFQDKEQDIKIGNDTFIITASKIETTHHLFTLTNVSHISNKLNRDPLTGIYRKSYLNTIMQDKIKQRQLFSLIVLDLDDFKKVNDTYGHIVGDAVLKQFVQLIEQNIDKNDCFARWGGEEFLLLFLSTDVRYLQDKLENLRKQIEEYKFDIASHITCSFGATCSTYDDEEIDTILYRADKALYEAKKAGKNKIIFKIN